MKAIPKSEINTKDGILTGVDYQANDKTGEVIKSISKAILISQGVPIPTSVGIFSTGQEACSPKTLNTFKELSLIKDNLKTINETRDREIAKLSNGYKTLDPNSNTYDQHITKLRKLYNTYLEKIDPTQLTDENKKLLEAASAVQTQMKSEIEASSNREAAWTNSIKTGLTSLNQQASVLAEDYDKKSADLIAPLTFTWVPRPDENRSASKEATLEGQGINRWFDESVQAAATTHINKLRDSLKLKLGIKSCGVKAITPPSTEETAIYYRTPEYCDISLTLGTSNEEIERVPLMQFGHTSKIAITNGAFQENQYALIFDAATGELNKYSYITSSAAASNAAASLTSSYDTIKQNDLEKIANKKSELDAEKGLYQAEQQTLAAKEAYEKALKAYEDAKKATP